MTLNFAKQVTKPQVKVPLGGALTDAKGKPVDLVFREPGVAEIFEASTISAEIVKNEPDWSSSLRMSIGMLAACHVTPNIDGEMPYQFYTRLARDARDLFFLVLGQFKAAFPDGGMGSTEQAVANSKNA
jgi:hypothetical protein